MVSTDLPTPEEFEQAQEAIENEEFPEEAPHFLDAGLANEFDDYTEFMAYRAAQQASWGARSASAAESALDNYEHYGKILLLALGAGALVEAVIGDARF